MALKTMLGAGLVAGLLNFGVSSVSAQVAEVESKPYSSDLLERVRQAATTISGELAATISFTFSKALISLGITGLFPMVSTHYT